MQIRDDFISIPMMTDLARYCVTEFVKSVAQDLPVDSTILDAGAGECAYKKLFEHCNYKSVDLAVGDEYWNYEHLDYVAPLDNIPVEDEVFDAVLCTQVLEHLQKPVECVTEMHRVLKAGGRLFLTAPMSQNEHQIPHDYYRFTSFGLKYICEQAGFDEIEIRPMRGMFFRWAYELPRMYALLPGTGLRKGGFRFRDLFLLSLKAMLFLMIRIVQIVLVKFDDYVTVTNDPWGWKVIARKKMAVRQ